VVFSEGDCNGETGGLGVEDDDIVSECGMSHFIEMGCKTVGYETRWMEI
jgi:hypothetical protein